MKDEFVSTEHLLVALTNVDSKAKQILEVNGVREAMSSRPCKRFAAAIA